MLNLLKINFRIREMCQLALNLNLQSNLLANFPFKEYQSKYCKMSTHPAVLILDALVDDECH